MDIWFWNEWQHQQQQQQRCFHERNMNGLTSLWELYPKPKRISSPSSSFFLSFFLPSLSLPLFPSYISINFCYQLVMASELSEKYLNLSSYELVAFHCQQPNHLWYELFARHISCIYGTRNKMTLAQINCITCMCIQSRFVKFVFPNYFIKNSSKKKTIL